MCNSVIFGYAIYTTVDSILSAVADEEHYDNIMTSLIIALAIMSLNLITTCGVLLYSVRESQESLIRQKCASESSNVNKCGVFSWYFRPISRAITKVGVVLVGKITEEDG